MKQKEMQDGEIKELEEEMKKLGEKIKTKKGNNDRIKQSIAVEG